MTSMSRSGGEEETYEEVDLKGSSAPQQHQRTESSDAEVGSLIDCLEEEEENNKSLSDHEGDKDDEIITTCGNLTQQPSMTSMSRSGGEEETYEEVDSKGLLAPQQHQRTESSDGEVGSLLDCLEEEEEEDNKSLSDHEGDEDEEIMTTCGSPTQQQPSMTSISKSGGEEKTFEAMDLKGSSAPQQHQQTESSDGEVGSLIDCLEEEEEEDNQSLSDRDGDEDDESMTNAEEKSTDKCSTTDAVDGSYHHDAEKYKQQQERLRKLAEQQMAKHPLGTTAQTTCPDFSKKYYTMHGVISSVPDPDGIAFNLNDPWQRSMLKQLEEQDVVETKDNDDVAGPKRSCDKRIFVGHTDSRDYAVSWDDDASAFSLDTTASSTGAPTRIQFVHRMMTPQMGNHSQPPTVVGYCHNPVNGNYTPAVTPEEDSASATAITTAKAEGRDDSATSSKHTVVPMEATSPRTVITEHSAQLHRKNRPIGNYITEYDNNNGGAAFDTTTTDPACYCLGYNMLDYLLIGNNNNNPVASTIGTTSRRGSMQRFKKSSRPLVRVLEDEPLEHHIQHHHQQQQPHQHHRRPPQNSTTVTPVNI